ncbi:MAG TPA: hypothetical protein VGR46_04790 [Candidatus Limnocylindria bacterium]|jgi:hypothetical protein|nr:hypothetical protein [Candidatus Limnocylindria bacterium]
MGGSPGDRGSADFEFAMGVALLAITVIVALVLLQGQLASLLARV